VGGHKRKIYIEETEADLPTDTDKNVLYRIFTKEVNTISKLII
jgi:hypothetical protein